MESLAMSTPTDRSVPLNLLTRKREGTRRCPACGAQTLNVLESRPRSDGLEVRRRIGCTTCRRRFTTVETIIIVGDSGPPIDPRSASHFQRLYASLSSADRKAVTRIMRAFKSVGKDDDDGTGAAGGDSTADG